MLPERPPDGGPPAELDELGTDTTRTSIGGEESGPVIGRYRLLHKIGEGGMGEVWLADQIEPVRRRVAVKLIKPGASSRAVIARFESERQALALMDHPAIAKVFDAGTTPAGAPYFVMEYIAGMPITSYCDTHRLTTRQRLDLFARVCEGVQHAHQKAIIHRDLKPSNILVADVDGLPVPKIIDFGVAKALGQKLTADTMFTQVGALVGTPEYMSPEQADPSRDDIDTRTDVYSLGIVLYVLLAGLPPFELRQVAFEEFLRRLREDAPPRPSTRFRTHDHDSSTDVARKRQTEPLTLSRQLRGDLDAIALKALEKERARRFGTPAELAADIRRYLNNEAVLAVPPSVAYRARKFARRYRAALATLCAFVVVLVLATGVSVWQGMRATEQRDRADAAAAAAEAVSDFLRNDLLAQASAASQSGPSAKPDPDVKVRTALDRAAGRIAGKFDRQPDVEAAIRSTIGQTYTDLGLYPEARTHLERALDLYRRTAGADDEKTLLALNRLGNVARYQARYDEAATLQGEALEIARRTLGPEHPRTATHLSNVGLIYVQQGLYAKSESLLDEALAIQRRVLGPAHSDTLAAMNSLAYAYIQQRKYEQAEGLQEQVVEVQRRTAGSEHPRTLASMNNLALIYARQGKFIQAEALDGQTLEVRRRVLGPEHSETLGSMNNLADDYNGQGKYPQAEPVILQTLALKRRVNGPEHPRTLTAMNTLAATLAGLGRHAQADALYGQTLEISRRVLGAKHSFTLEVLADTAGLYRRLGKYDQAKKYVEEALSGLRNALGHEHPDTIAAVVDLALANVSQKKFADGEALVREAVELNRRIQPDDWSRFRAESVLGASLAGQARYADAEPLLVAGYEGMAARKGRVAVSEWHHLDSAREWIVELYRATGAPGKAVEWSKRQ